MATHIPDFTYEQALKETYPSSIFIGIDEAGRGPLAGPVVAATACYRQADFRIPEGLEKEFAFIRDSKKLSPKKRDQMFDCIQEYFDIGIGIIHSETIDRINILEATFLAMKEAIGELQRKLRVEADEGGIETVLLVDGNQKIPNISLRQETVVSGDGLVKSIAAASIIAKVTRDRIMEEYDRQYPHYGFTKHKGYGTKLHTEALERFGPTPIHRLSFAPVAQSVLRFKELGIIS